MQAWQLFELKRTKQARHELKRKKTKSMYWQFGSTGHLVLDPDFPSVWVRKLFNMLNFGFQQWRVCVQQLYTPSFPWIQGQVETLKPRIVRKEKQSNPGWRHDGGHVLHWLLANHVNRYRNGSMMSPKTGLLFVYANRAINLKLNRKLTTLPSNPKFLCRPFCCSSCSSASRYADATVHSSNV
jgi:hypothetical protein